MEIEFVFLNALQGIHAPWLDTAMIALTTIGDEGIVWILLGLILLIFKQTRQAGVAVLVSLAVMVVLNNLIIKNVVARPRPFVVQPGVDLLIAAPSGFSFPSGHASSSFAAVTALFLSKRKAIWIPALILALLIAFSRMYLYVHFPTDIIGGMVLGIIYGVVGFYLTRVFFNWLASRRKPPKHAR